MSEGYIPVGGLAESKVRGCLVGGALGDALGAPVEFMSWPDIRERYGPAGIAEVPIDAGFTDDTQMTLFTAEGLIRASVRGRSRGIWYPPAVVWHAYLRWLHTQGVPWTTAGAHLASDDAEPDGWLVHEAVLHRQMAPGNTCLAALKSGRMGTPEEPLNDSKGCGAVMRAAPVGLIAADRRHAFDLGCEIGAITHGHPDGYGAAGALAAIVFAAARENMPLDGAVETALPLLDRSDGVRRLLQEALALRGRAPLDPDRIEASFGRGWVGDEALAIGVYCALTAKDFPSGIRRSVNHSGDSDSTGSIAGNLLGLTLGAPGLPSEWVARLRGVDVVERIAHDLWQEATDPRSDEYGEPPGEWWAKYPGW